MPFEPFERVRIGSTSLEPTRLGLGGASIGGLYRSVSDADALDLVEYAWTIGIRSFDVAPLYGYGTAEQRMGTVLASHPRDAFVLSTKVGRLVRSTADLQDGDDIDRQVADGREDGYYADTEGRRMVFDYSYDGVMRSVETSLQRSGLSRIDILYIHDPEDHWTQAIEGAYPALARLRSDGVVGAIGVGMGRWQVLARFADAGDFDIFMVAGRYSLLDHGAHDVLLPRCLERGIAVMIAGVMNSGILADQRPGAHFDYRDAAPDVVDRARRITEVCQRHGVPVRAAAIQFPLAHPAVIGLVAGVRQRAHLDEYPAFMRLPIPSALWDDLRCARLIPDAAPTPD